MKFLTPKTHEEWLKLRAEDITSTEISVLFDQSPYLTTWELYQRKVNRELGEIGENERMTWGKRLEDVIAEGVAADEGVILRPSNPLEYLRDPERCHFGTSFDRVVEAADDLAIPSDIAQKFYAFGPGLMEIKNVDLFIFLDQWMNEDRDIVPPVHIEMQLQWQMEVSGFEWGVIVAFVGGNKPHLLIRRRDHEVGAGMAKRVIEFWDRVDRLDEPEINFDTDASFVIDRFKRIAEGKTAHMGDNKRLDQLFKAYVSAGQLEKMHKEEKEKAKAEILTIIDDHNTVTTDLGKISTWDVAEKQVPASSRKGFRGFRITPKKD